MKRLFTLLCLLGLVVSAPAQFMRVDTNLNLQGSFTNFFHTNKALLPGLLPSLSAGTAAGLTNVLMARSNNIGGTPYWGVSNVLTTNGTYYITGGPGVSSAGATTGGGYGISGPDYFSTNFGDRALGVQLYDNTDRADWLQVGISRLAAGNGLTSNPYEENTNAWLQVDERGTFIRLPGERPDPSSYGNDWPARTVIEVNTNNTVSVIGSTLMVQTTNGEVSASIGTNGSALFADVTASSFVGGGSGLTDVNAANVTNGVALLGIATNIFKGDWDYSESFSTYPNQTNFIPPNWEFAAYQAWNTNMLCVSNGGLVMPKIVASNSYSTWFIRRSNSLPVQRAEVVYRREDVAGPTSDFYSDRVIFCVRSNYNQETVVNGLLVWGAGGYIAHIDLSPYSAALNLWTNSATSGSWSNSPGGSLSISYPRTQGPNSNSVAGYEWMSPNSIRVYNADWSTIWTCDGLTNLYATNTVILESAVLAKTTETVNSQVGTQPYWETVRYSSRRGGNVSLLGAVVNAAGVTTQAVCSLPLSVTGTLKVNSNLTAAGTITGSSIMASNVTLLNLQPVTTTVQGASVCSDGTNLLVVLQDAGGTKTTNKVTMTSWP